MCLVCALLRINYIKYHGPYLKAVFKYYIKLEYFNSRPIQILQNSI